MPRAHVPYVIFIALGLLIDAPTAHAAIAGLHRVASGLSAPMFVTHPPGDRNRLFIAERGGAIRVVDLTTGALLPTPFLSMSGIDTDGEGGFLGLAFHPDYYQQGAVGFGKFYVKVTTTTAGDDLTTRVREFQVSAGDANVADPSSMREILNYTNPQTNHVGGWIGFSPHDSYLYVANGDGGGGNDTGDGHTAGTGNAQDITSNWLGKMLRVDVDGDDFTTDANRNYAIPPTNPFVAGVGPPGDDVGDDEIWSYGLRNPFRSSFDRITGNLWIGDVGQGAREEIDFQPANSVGGENYGWRLREGTIATPTAGIGGNKPAGNVDPVYDYERPLSNPTNDPAVTAQNQYRGTVVIGGYAYRGSDPSLQGQYFFLDRSAGDAGINYWMFDPESPAATVQNIDSLMTPNTGSATGPVSMGEDALGNLYIAYFSGNVYRIATNELLSGDINADGTVDSSDYVVWRKTGGSEAAYNQWRQNFGASVHNLAPGSGAAAPEPVAFVLALQLLWGMAAFRSRPRPTPTSGVH